MVDGTWSIYVDRWQLQRSRPDSIQPLISPITMDEEYDVSSALESMHRHLLTLSSGHRSRHWLDGMYPLRSPIRGGQEGPPHGQE